MKLESIVFAIAGACFGMIVGWVIGAQQVSGTRSRPAQTQIDAAAQPAEQSTGSSTGQTTSRAAILDESHVRALQAVVDKDPNNATARAQLGDLYFDADRYGDAIKWYETALKLNPKDVNVSTDLGISYYYTNQADLALKQFAYSLSLDPKHLKTLLNLGIVCAFGKQDLQGAIAAWKQVIEIAPNSSEGQTAKRALDSIAAAHPALGSGSQPDPAR